MLMPIFIAILMQTGSIDSFSFRQGGSTGLPIRKWNHGLIQQKCARPTLQRVYSGRNDKPEYSREIILREEAESPFRKIRFFAYASLGAAAATSLLISGTRVIAGLNGINTDLLDESLYNCGVDVVGIIVLSFAWQRDVIAQNSRFKRAAKGAELAKLNVKVSKSILNDSDIKESDLTERSASRFTTSLASLRRGRGMEKRVVIAVGNTERIQSIIKEATKINDALQESDLLIVPVVIEPPSGTIKPLPTDLDIDTLPDCIALPATAATSGSWKIVISDEMEEAMKQDINVYDDGFCVILKKNGRVGQRTRGIFLSNMVGDVTQRREAGMDVVNI
jgi:hypothetical protein